ncbi:MAG: hypothetical protein ACFFGP_11540 [Promethearchaeota archaeon]
MGENIRYRLNTRRDPPQTLIAKNRAKNSKFGIIRKLKNVKSEKLTVKIIDIKKLNNFLFNFNIREVNKLNATIMKEILIEIGTL